MAPLLLRGGPEWPARVLQIGLGAASITRFLYRHRPAAKLTVVEIDPEVIAAARHHFRLPEENPQLRIVVADGHEHVAMKDRKYDLIVVDGYDSRGRAGMLDSEPFYLNCRRRLTRQGMISVNLLTRSRGVGPSVERMRRAFDGRVLVLPPSEAGNTVVLAAEGDAIDEPLRDLRDAAHRLKAQTGLDLAPMLARVGKARAGERIVL